MSDPRLRILIASPIHQQPAILTLFLHSLRRLNLKGIEATYSFIDDNTIEASQMSLALFAANGADVHIQTSERQDHYVRTDKTHYWNEYLVWKVAEFKNRFIREAIQGEYDYLFLIDSDLLLHPNTLVHLAAQRKEIISEIFWTRWQPDARPQPQVWLMDEYEQWERRRGESVAPEEAAVRFEAFLSLMQIPGVHEVGGLGACTLISRQALRSGVHFAAIPNLSFWGEDRHFCIRAAALGLKLFVDTHYPAYHIYRDSDLMGTETFLRGTDEVQITDEFEQEATEEVTEEDSQIAAQGASHEDTARESSDDLNGEDNRPGILTNLSSDHESTLSSKAERKRPRLTLSMVVKNEQGRYLERALAHHRAYIDEAVIIDDGSTDDTAELCLQALEGIPVKLIRNGLSKFANEVTLRKQQWEETIATNPDWILNLDADEWFEDLFAVTIRDLLNECQEDSICFRLYDFWTETSYRDDQYWSAHHVYRPLLHRYRPDFIYEWKETPQHCGRYPANLLNLSHSLSNLRLKHYGWANPDERASKARRYSLLDPDAKYGWQEQYDSIMDANPRLIEWQE